MDENKEIIKYGAFSVVGVILILMVLNSVKFIGIGQKAVVFNRFSGEITKTLGQGVSFINPISDKIKRYNVQITKEVYEMDGLSSDSQTIKCKIVVNYKLQALKLKEIYQTVQGDISETILFNAVVDTTKTELGKFTINDIAKNRESLKTAIQTALTQRMKTQYVDIENISVTNIDFSAEFEKSIQDKMIAEQQALQAKNMKEKTIYESEAKAIENQKLGATISPMVLKQKWIEKWNGKLPNVMTNGNSSLLMSIDEK